MRSGMSETLLKQADLAITQNGDYSLTENLSLGVDLGTATIVLVVLNSRKMPVACEIEAASVVKDGLVVDYHGAMEIVRRLKSKLENRLGVRLARAAIAVPPGTSPENSGAHRHVVEACDLVVTTIVDEPTAANEVLEINSGVIVDIGGGTTGLTIFQNSKPVYTADEPTGGVHISLVLMGGRKISFEDAEKLKQSPSEAANVMGMVKPVIQKMASITKKHIRGSIVDNIWLVGGTCCLTGFENVFEQEMEIPTFKPIYPHMVTPLGIAMSCRE